MIFYGNFCIVPPFTMIKCINDHVAGISADVSKKHNQYLQENVRTWQKTKNEFFTNWYTSDICQKFCYLGWYMTVLVYKQYVKVSKMTKIKNSGIQTSICGNLVYEKYMNKKSCLKLYTNLFLLWIVHIMANLIFQVITVEKSLVGNVIDIMPTCHRHVVMSARYCKILKLLQMSTTQRIFFILSHVSVACRGHKL